MPVLPALGRQRQEDQKFQTNLDYIVSSSLSKKLKGLELEI
jgi:hypothetical protein